MELTAKQQKLAIKIGITLLVLLISFFGLTKAFANPERYKGQIEYLDEKKSAVLTLSAASTAASVAVTALPGDIATPVAEKLADLSMYFLLIVSAIFLEKNLLSLTGFVAFRIFIPIACILMIIYFVNKNLTAKRVALRLGAFAIAGFLLVPTSVKVSQMIEQTSSYSLSDSVDEIVGTQKEMTDRQEDTSTSSSTKTEEEKSWWAKLWDKAEEAVSKGVSTVTEIPEKLTDFLNQMLEALAMLIVTACVIPVVVIIIFVWMAKLFFGVEGKIAVVPDFRIHAPRIDRKSREEDDEGL